MSARPTRPGRPRGSKATVCEHLGSIRRDELLPLPVLRQRLGWGHRSVAEAKNRGLILVPFGRQKFVFGADVLDWFASLKREGSDR